jgi:glutamate-1-semialdehyde 2,1-aminomutase
MCVSPMHSLPHIFITHYKRNVMVMDMASGHKIRALKSPSEIELRYREATVGSARLMEEAAGAMPGGNTRTTNFYPPYPIVIEHAEGAWLRDVDQRRYVDLFCNGLSLIHGNGYAPVREAIQAALVDGSAWAGASRIQIGYAELLRDRIPALESLRFTNSGSEAGMLAVKAARRATGRRYIVKAYGAYHGSYPDLEAGLYGQSNIEGRALVATFNDIASYERVMAEHGRDVAAIVIEPVLVTGRVVAPAPGFLNEVEALARRFGALSVVDDCLMLRLAVGGSNEKFSLRPDIVVLGKFLGGGTPLGAFGGSRSLMKMFDPTRAGCIFHGGSFNGNPLGCSAGYVTLTQLTAARIAAMDAACVQIREALKAAGRKFGVEVQVTGVGSVVGIAFPADPMRHEDDPAALGLASLFHLACLNEGVMIGPGGIITVSTAHDEVALDFAIHGMANALGSVGRLLESLR